MKLEVYILIRKKHTSHSAPDVFFPLAEVAPCCMCLLLGSQKEKKSIVKLINSLVELTNVYQQFYIGKLVGVNR